MATSLAERLIGALTVCPCCTAPRLRERWPGSGIPKNCLRETAFACGAAVFVTTKAEYELALPCPGALDLALDDLQQKLTEEERADA